MSLRKGSKVWVDDKNLAWVAAEVLDCGGKQVQVLTVSGKKVEVTVPPPFFVLFFSKFIELLFGSENLYVIFEFF